MCSNDGYRNRQKKAPPPTNHLIIEKRIRPPYLQEFSPESVSVRPCVKSVKIDLQQVSFSKIIV